MGLRLKIIAALLLIFVALATVASYGLRWEMERSFLAREQAESISDLRRLLLALDAQVAQLDSMLDSWANWTALYQHAVRPDPAFVREEMTPESIQYAHFDWLILVSNKGQLLHQVEVPRANGKLHLAERMQAEPKLRDWFNTMQASTARACGIVRIGEQLSLLCYSPLHASDGKGEAHGVLIVGRWFQQSALEAVRAQTQLDFSIRMVDPLPVAADLKASIESRFGKGDPVVVEHPDAMAVNFPLVSIRSHQIGELTLHWPRSARMEAAESIQKNQHALLLLIAVTGSLMILVVDRLVVRRLVTMRHELASIGTDNRWQGHVSAQGSDEIADLGRFINSNMDLIRTQMLELHNLSTTDTLTGLPNRRRFDEQLERALAHHERKGTPLALVLIDVDCFKKYNDTYGHPAGDEALRQVATCLRQGARRPGDLPARIGGEEFAVVCEDTDLQGARECAESIRQCLIQANISHSTNTAAAVVTISCGVALVRMGDTQRTLYSRADAALYLAKEHGRNRVAVEAPTQAPPP